MKSTKIKILLKSVSVIFLFLILYSFLVMYMLGSNSVSLKQIFEENSIKGKPIGDAIKILGEPSKITNKKHNKIDNNGMYISDQGENYSILTYYTDNSILNSLGYFPFGGSRVYVNDKGIVYLYEPYLD